MGGTAIFDLDRTLTRSGTWTRFVLRVNGRRPLFWLKLPWFGFLAVAYKLGLVSRKTVKEYGVSTLRWATRAHLEAMAEAFAADEVPGGLRKQAMSVLSAHREAGTKLVLATASAELTAIPIARAMGFDHVIATKLEWDEKDRLTGRLDGENCYDEEKLRRVENDVATHGFSHPISFYSDHVSDLPVLLWADQGIVVNPHAKLRAAAAKEGLPIVDWDASA